MLKPNHISPKRAAAQEKPFEPERAPAGLLEYKYNPVIGFK